MGSKKGFVFPETHGFWNKSEEQHGGFWKFMAFQYFPVMSSDLGLDGIGMGFIQQYLLGGRIFKYLQPS